MLSACLRTACLLSACLLSACLPPACCLLACCLLESACVLELICASAAHAELSACLPARPAVPCPADQLPPGCKPVLVFVNTKSGPQVSGWAACRCHASTHSSYTAWPGLQAFQPASSAADVLLMCSCLSRLLLMCSCLPSHACVRVCLCVQIGTALRQRFLRSLHPLQVSTAHACCAAAQRCPHVLHCRACWLLPPPAPSCRCFRCYCMAASLPHCPVLRLLCPCCPLAGGGASTAEARCRAGAVCRRGCPPAHPGCGRGWQRGLDSVLPGGAEGGAGCAGQPALEAAACGGAAAGHRCAAYAACAACNCASVWPKTRLGPTFARVPWYALIRRAAWQPSSLAACQP